VSIAALIGPLIWIIVIARVVVSLSKNAKRQQQGQSARYGQRPVGSTTVNQGQRGRRPITARPKTHTPPSGRYAPTAPADARQRPALYQTSMDALYESAPNQFEGYISPEGSCNEHPEHDRILPQADMPEMNQDTSSLYLPISSDAMVQAFVWSEILAKPKGMRLAQRRV